MSGRERRGQAGMTLVELMIAMVILGVVVAAAFNVAYTMMNGYRDHRRAVAVERAARGAMRVLADAVRNASPGVGDGNILDAITCASTGAIAVVNDTDAPDQLRVVYGKGGVITSARSAYATSDAAIDVHDGSLFKAGDHALILDLSATPTKAHLVQVDTVSGSGAAWTLTLAQAPSNCPSPVGDAYTYPALSTVVRVERAEFWISASDVPVLMMDLDGIGVGDPSLAIAEGIEDLQVALGIDADNDGTVPPDNVASSTDEWIYNHPSDAPAGAVTAGGYRAIRLTVTARSIDETSNVPISVRPPVEDRDAGTAADVYRRRTLSATIDVRNLEGSPE